MKNKTEIYHEGARAPCFSVHHRCWLRGRGEPYEIIDVVTPGRCIYIYLITLYAYYARITVARVCQYSSSGPSFCARITRTHKHIYVYTIYCIFTTIPSDVGGKDDDGLYAGRRRRRRRRLQGGSRGGDHRRRSKTGRLLGDSSAT